MNRIDVDTVSRYLTLVLIAVLIVALIIIVIIPSTETRSTCAGFQYFIFLNHKMTEDTYEIEVLNGVRDIDVMSAYMDSIDLGIGQQRVGAGEKFILKSSTDPTHRKTDEIFGNRLTINYGVVDGIKDNRDVATCTGRVQ